MAVDRTDEFVANDYGLEQQRKSVRIIAGYDTKTQQVREANIDSQG